MLKWVPRPACQPGLFMKPALLMARFQRSKQAFKIRNQVDLMRIALRRNNMTWIDHGFHVDHGFHGFDSAKEEEIKRKALEAKESEVAALKSALEHAAAQDKSQLEQKLAALQKSNETLRQDLAAATEKTLSIAQQTKKGHVYVISNVGAFGEGIYKIGQTRRLDRQERIDELGDASVPFEFDVHAWIESDNAPALEHKLQKRFLAMQMNKINARKEFFRVSLKEIREEIDRLSQTDSFAVTHWSEIANAAEYRETLDIQGDPEKLAKWLKRQTAITDREIRRDSQPYSFADIEPEGGHGVVSTSDK